MFDQFIEQFFTMLKRLQQADFLLLVMEPLFYLGVFLGGIDFLLSQLYTLISQ